MYKLSIREVGFIIVILLEKHSTGITDLYLEAGNLRELAEETKVVLENHFQYGECTWLTQIEKGVDEKVSIHFYPKVLRSKSEILLTLENFLDACIIPQAM